MIRKLGFGGLVPAVALLTGLVFAVPASAQSAGSLKGHVLDDKGKPVAEAIVIVSKPNDPTFKPVSAVTSSGSMQPTSNGMVYVEKGTFSFDSLRFGEYQVDVQKGNLIGRYKSLATVRPNDMADIGDIPMHVGTPEELRAAPAAGASATTTTGKEVSEADVAKLAAENAKWKGEIDAANAAMAAGNYDDALKKLQNILTKFDKCAPCYINLGKVQVHNGDDKTAEENFQKAITLGPEKDMAAAYDGLATIYNKQGKLEEAAKANAKSNELQEAGGGGNATSSFNQGVILWNQGDKAAEAEVQFRKAVKLDPTMADAQYFLGMCLINQGKMTEAKEPFNQYLKLQPKGKYAQDVKDILAAIK